VDSGAVTSATYSPPPRATWRRGRVDWRLLTVLLVVLVGAAAWYVLWRNPVGNVTGTVALRKGLVLAGVSQDRRLGFLSYVWRDDSVLPITILGVEPLPAASDWRVRAIRLGTVAAHGEWLEGTRPFSPQHLGPGDSTSVVVVYEGPPCGSPQLADGTVGGPVHFRVVYTILGLHRTLAFHEDGASFTPVSLGCVRR
jgi:hypothetical protein